MNNILNFKKIIKNKFDLDEIKTLCENTNGICEIDLFILKEFLTYIKAKKIVEFGCGTSTIFFNNLNLQVYCYALECMSTNDITNYKNINFKCCCIEDCVEEIKNKVFESDMLIIDCAHTAEQATLYTQNILKDIKKPFFVHDFFGYNTNGYPWAEQLYLKEWIKHSNDYELFLYTDVEEEEIPEVTKLLNYDLKLQKAYAGHRPPPCSAIFIPKNYE